LACISDVANNSQTVKAEHVDHIWTVQLQLL